MGITPMQLRDLAAECASRWPTAELVKNSLGNLAVMVDGEYVGWLDLRTAEINE